MDVNPFHANGLFRYSLKTSENQRFSDVFREYRKRPMAWNGLRNFMNFNVHQCSYFYLVESDFLQKWARSTICIQLFPIVWENTVWVKQLFFYLISTSFPGFSVSFWFPFSLNERETKNLGKEVSFTYQAKQVSINIENRPQGKLSSEMRMDCHMRNQQVLFNFFYDVTPSESNQKVKAKDESIKHISYLLVCVLPVHDNWYNREKKCCFWIGNISKNKSLWERATKYQTHHFKPLQGAVDYE